MHISMMEYASSVVHGFYSRTWSRARTVAFLSRALEKKKLFSSLAALTKCLHQVFYFMACLRIRKPLRLNTSMYQCHPPSWVEKYLLFPKVPNQMIALFKC